MKTLRDFCFYTPFIVLFLSIIFSFVLFIPITEFKEYFPGWLRSNMEGWTFVVIWMVNTVLSFFSITVMLNVFRFVRDHMLLSFLTFFWAVIADYIMILLHPDHPDFGFNLLIPSAFLIPQTFLFVLFRKKLKRGDFDS